MMMKRSIVLISLVAVLAVVFLFFFFFFFTGMKIEGYVIDAFEKKPIASVRILINDREYYTNKEGYFVAYKPLYPPPSLTAEKNGYKRFNKNIKSQSLLGNKRLEILLDPLTYPGILDAARKDLASYHNYSFRYSWFSHIGLEDERHTYMIYQLGNNILRFKYLQDDYKGDLITAREIIRTSDTIFYQEDDSNNWIKIREEDITLSKMQDPFDILQIFHEEEPPTLFLFKGRGSLYEYSDGMIRTMEEKEGLASELVYQNEIPVSIFSSEWKKETSNKRVKLYLNENYKLIRADLFDETVSHDEEKPIKQNLIIYISSINQDIFIDIPSI